MGLTVGLTGADGFVGLHLSEALTNAGHTVIPFTGDLLKKEDVAEYFAHNTSIEAVVHLAGLAGGDDWQALTAVNVVGTTNLLEGMKERNIAKLIFASSGAVYGDAKGESSREYDPLQPNTAYGFSKLWAEQAITFFAQTGNLQFTILRFANIYGPGNRKGVVYWLRHGIKESGAVTINGDGTQVRNFLYIDDAVQAFMCALTADVSGVFNIAPDKSYTLNEIIDELQKVYTFTINHQPADNQLQRLILNTERAKRELGFHAEYETIKTDYEL